MKPPQQQFSVVLYTRQACGLCQGVEDMLHKHVKHGEVTVVDIDTDDTLLKRYALRIPVVTINGVEVVEGKITDKALRQAVRAAQAASSKTRQSRWRFWA